jgi:hypothetical protein
VRALGRSPGGKKIFSDIHWRFLLAAFLFLAVGIVSRR